MHFIPTPSSLPGSSSPSYSAFANCPLLLGRASSPCTCIIIPYRVSAGVVVRYSSDCGWERCVGVGCDDEDEKKEKPVEGTR